MQNKEKKVLLRISNLKQYFPLKGGRFVKANDGISLDIYEGETFGLVGESGCGKSTLGRTILQLYHQTYGRTMYYGRSLDDLAPKYVTETVKHLKKRRIKLRELEEKRDKLEAEYAKLSEKEQYAKHGELDTARKLAEDALLDITKIVGGFLVVEDLDPVIAIYSKGYGIARKLSAMEEKPYTPARSTRALTPQLSARTFVVTSPPMSPTRRFVLICARSSVCAPGSNSACAPMICSNNICISLSVFHYSYCTAKRQKIQAAEKTLPPPFPRQSLCSPRSLFASFSYAAYRISPSRGTVSTVPTSVPLSFCQPKKVYPGSCAAGSESSASPGA